MPSGRHPGAVLIAVVMLGAMVALAADQALAQAPPSAFARPAPSSGQGGMIAFIVEQQAAFYRQLAGAVRAIRGGDTGALATLAGLSLAYGVLHAAGPGHGKAVISSYIVATGETIRRGILLAGLSALVQALVAIALVAALSILIGATARTMTGLVWWIELAAYALIALIGARLVWTKGRAFLVRFAAWRAGRVPAGLGCDDGCVHLPPAEQIARQASWRETAGIVLAVGLRPCTGAVLVLVFAAAQGIFAAGVLAALAMAVGTAVTVAVLASLAAGAKGLAVRMAAARPGLTTVGLSAFEVVAASVVLLFGLALMTGAIVLEPTSPL